MLLMNHIHMYASAQPAMKINKGKVRYFVGDSDYQEICEILQCIAPECDVCGGIKNYICLEKECQSHAVLCLDCDKHQH